MPTQTAELRATARPGDVFEKALAGLTALGGALLHLDEQGWTFVGTIPSGLRSFGEVVEVRLLDANGTTVVQARSRSRLATTLLDYGKNRDNVFRLLSTIEPGAEVRLGIPDTPWATEALVRPLRSGCRWDPALGCFGFLAAIAGVVGGADLISGPASGLWRPDGLAWLVLLPVAFTALVGWRLLTGRLDRGLSRVLLILMSIAVVVVTIVFPLGFGLLLRVPAASLHH